MQNVPVRRQPAAGALAQGQGRGNRASCDHLVDRLPVLAVGCQITGCFVVGSRSSSLVAQCRVELLAKISNCPPSRISESIPTIPFGSLFAASLMRLRISAMIGSYSPAAADIMDGISICEMVRYHGGGILIEETRAIAAASSMG